MPFNRWLWVVSYQKYSFYFLSSGLIFQNAIANEMLVDIFKQNAILNEIFSGPKIWPNHKLLVSAGHLCDLPGLFSEIDNLSTVNCKSETQN